jgi:class 3 adenylate cyclase
MDISLYLVMAVPVAGGALLVALLLYAHSRRVFARFANGVFHSAASTIMAMALIAAAVIGTWGYEAARHIMRAEMTLSLDSIATIIQQQIELEVVRAVDRLEGLAKAAAPALQPGGDLKDLAGDLQAIQDFSPRYLEIDAIDSRGTLVASSEVDPKAQPHPYRIATAFNLDGKNFVSEATSSPTYKRVVVYIGVPVRNASGAVVGALGTVFDLQTVFDEVIEATKFNQSGYAVVVGGDGRILADPDHARIGADASSYPAVLAARQQRSGQLVAANSSGELRQFFYRQITNPQTVDARPWVLLTEIDEAEALKPLVELRDELAAGVGVLIVISLIIAWSAARSLGRPISTLEDVAGSIEAGDFTRSSRLTGQDAFSRLGGAFDRMTKGLQERDRVKDVFGRYIAKQAAEVLLKGPLDLGGEAKRVTILFSDIRGFSTMAETMTPEQIVTFLNAYFSEMVDAVMEQEGMLDKFIGDGLMAVFGSFGDQPDHARRAVVASLRMKALLGKINGDRATAGKAPIEIGIGIHTDEVIVGSIGSKQRLEFTHIGDGVNTASRVQALNKEYHTTILITGATFEALGGEFLARRIAEVTLRGKSKSLPIYEVVSSGSTVRG